MKRFIPFMMGLTLICLSFTFNNDIESNNSEIESFSSEDDAVNTVVKICDYMAHFTQNQYQCDPSSAHLTVDNNCNGRITVFVRVTNLVANPILGKTYPLPANADNLYYEYTANGLKTKIPVTQFMYRFDRNSQPVYEWSQEIGFDASQNCDGGPRTEFFCDVRLIKQDDTDYELINNSDSNGLFSCMVFEETCYNCAPGTYPCNAYHDLRYNILVCGEPCPSHCNPKGKAQNESDIESMSLNNDETADGFTVNPDISVQKDDRLLDIEVSPNPFMNILEMKFNQINNSNFTMEILNLNGVVVKRKEYGASQNKSITVDVSDIPAGLYYFKVTSDSQIFTKRIVKH